MLVTTLVAVGKTAEALAIRRGLAARFDVEPAPPERRTDLLVQLGRAALTAGDTDTAAGYAAAARGVVGQLDDAGTAAVLTARIDAVVGHVALEQGRRDEASALAHAAVAGAEATGQPAVECEALQGAGPGGPPGRPRRGVGLVRAGFQRRRTASAPGLAPAP